MKKAKEIEKKSEAQRVRLTIEENKALKDLAVQMEIKPSKIIRRLIREAVTKGPDFFDDGIKELQESNRQLAAIGRNLNRLVKMINSDKPVNNVDLKNEYESLQSGYAEMQNAYQELILRSKKRSVKIVK